MSWCYAHNEVRSGIRPPFSVMVANQNHTKHCVDKGPSIWPCAAGMMIPCLRMLIKVKKPNSKPKLQVVADTRQMTTCSSYVFLRSDTAATIYFATRFVRLLFEGGIYFFGKPGGINNSWKRYVRVRWWRLLDAVSSMRSLSVLLSAVGTTRTTQTILVLAWWPHQKSFANVGTCRVY